MPGDKRRGGPVRIVLTADDVAWAVAVAEARRGSTVCSNRDLYAHNSPSDALDCEIAGAGGELAVARWLNVDWDASVDRFRKGGDVAGIEVRTSRFRSRRHGLKVKKWEVADKPEMFVVWVVRDERRDPRSTYWVVGWIFAREAPELGSLEDPSRGRSTNKAEAYFVKRGRLRSPQLLLEQLRGGRR